MHFFLYIIKTLLTILWTPIFIFWFLVTYLFCIGGLAIFCINYRKLRGHGNGVFHSIFFKFPNLYFVVRIYRKIWNIGNSNDS